MATTYTYIGPSAESDHYLFTEHSSGHPLGDTDRLVSLSAREVQGLGLTDKIRNDALADYSQPKQPEYVQQGEAHGWRWVVVEGSLVIDNRPAVDAAKARVEDGEPFMPIEFQHVVLPPAVWDEMVGAVVPQ